METIYVIMTHEGVWDVYLADELGWANRDMADLAQEEVRAALLEYEVVQ